MEPRRAGVGADGRRGLRGSSSGGSRARPPAFESQSCRLLASCVPLASHLPSLCLFPDLQPGDDKGVYLIGLL